MTKYLINAALFVVAHYAALSMLAAAGYIFGWRLTRRVSYHCWIERLSFSLALGLGVIAYLIFFLGLLGLLYAWLVVALLAAGVWLCRPLRAGWLRQLSDYRKQSRSFCKANPKLVAGVAVAALAGLLIALPFFTRPLYPPLAFDSVMYHLPYAKIYVQQHGLVFTPFLRFAVAPQLNEMIFTLALLVYDDILAQLTEFLLLLALTAAVIALGRRLFSRRAGWWAGAIWLANPIVLWLGACAYVDMGLALFVILSFYAFLNWWEGGERHWLVLAGVFCGLAIGAKLSAVFALALIGAALFYTGLRKRNWSPLVLFAGIALLVALPWLARSFYYTRNPVFPFFQTWFNGWFGVGSWKPDFHDALSNFIFDRGHHHAQSESKLVQLLRLPWRLTFNSPFPAAPSSIFQGYLFILPLCVVAARSRAMRVMLALAGAYLLFWFFTIQDVRYLLPSLALLSVAAAAALDRCVLYLQSGWQAGWRRRAGGAALTAVGCLALVLPGLLHTWRSYPGRFPVTAEQRDAFITRMYANYPAYKFLNERRGRGYAVYVLIHQEMTYYADGQFIAGLFAPGGLARVFKGGMSSGQLIDGAPLYRTLKELGADQLLVETDQAPVTLPDDDFFKQHFKLIYEQPQLRLFELTEESSITSSGGAKSLSQPWERSPSRLRDLGASPSLSQW